MNTRQKLVTYIGIGVLLIAIPITLLVAQRRQQLQSGAEAPDPVACRVYADIAIVIDMSTSMDESIGGVTKKTAAIEAMRSFINSGTLDLDDSDGDGRRDRIGIVQFSNNENVRTISELTSNRTQLLSSLANLRTEEGTSIHKGLLAGRDLLNRGGTIPGQERRILLLSDGAMNIFTCDPNKPSCNNHLGDPDRSDQLGALRRDATTARQTADILAIYFGNQTDPGLSQIRDNVVDNPSKLIHANLTQGDITNAFLDAATLFTECPCQIRTVTQVRDAETNQLINISGFGWDNNQGAAQLFSPDRTEFIFAGAIPESAQGTADMSLTPINNSYTIESTFCYNNGAGGVDGCPAGIPQGNTGKGSAQVTISGLNVACGVDMTYGWRVKKKVNACTNSSIIEIRERDPNTGTITLLDGVSGFSTTSFVKGQQQGEVQEILEAGVNRREYRNVSLPKSLEFTNDVRVDLARQSTALNYTIVGTFCEENKTVPTGAACTPDVGHSRESLEGFTLLCDSDITYGWIVERVPTDALCYNLTCQDKQDLIDQGAPVNSLIPCTVDQIGTQPDICDANVCNSNLVCERVAIEDATPGTVDECPVVGELCPRPKNVCDDKACITIEDQNDPRYNNKTCATPGNPAPDCTVTVCDTDDTCKEFAEDDTKCDWQRNLRHHRPQRVCEGGRVF